MFYQEVSLSIPEVPKEFKVNRLSERAYETQYSFACNSLHMDEAQAHEYACEAAKKYLEDESE